MDLNKVVTVTAFDLANEALLAGNFVFFNLIVGKDFDTTAVLILAIYPDLV